MPDGCVPGQTGCVDWDGAGVTDGHDSQRLSGQPVRRRRWTGCIWFVGPPCPIICMRFGLGVVMDWPRNIANRSFGLVGMSGHQRAKVTIQCTIDGHDARGGRLHTPHAPVLMHGADGLRVGCLDGHLTAARERDANRRHHQ